MLWIRVWSPQAGPVVNLDRYSPDISRQTPLISPYHFVTTPTSDCASILPSDTASDHNGISPSLIDVAPVLLAISPALFIVSPFPWALLHITSAFPLMTRKFLPLSWTFLHPISTFLELPSSSHSVSSIILGHSWTFLQPPRTPLQPSSIFLLPTSIIPESTSRVLSTTPTFPFPSSVSLSLPPKKRLTTPPQPC